MIKKFTVWTMFLTFAICFCFVYSSHKVIAKDIRLTAKSLNIENARPENINGVIYLPLRSIFESLGWEVSWNDQSKTILCTNENRVIRFKAGSTKVDIDGRHYIMDEPLRILKDKSYIPQRFITEEFGLKVRWDKKDNIIITSDNDTTGIAVSGSGNIVILGDSLIVNIFEPYSIHTVSDMISYSDRLLASNNEEEAVRKYKEILDNISEEENPDIYAHVMNNLANAYSKLSGSKDSKNNILSAIGFYHKALNYYRNNNDANYSLTLNNLGSAYRILSDVTGNNMFLLNALICYNEALQYYTLPQHYMDYALIQYNLGKTYYDLGIPELSKEYLTDAKDVFSKALDIYSLDTEPFHYATVQFHLGIINNLLDILCPFEEGVTVRANNFEETDIKEIDNFKEALKVWTAESYPLNYAKAHEHMGEIYTKYYEKFGNVEYLIMAEKEYEEAIEFYSIERHPFLYAVANYKLGNLKLLFAKLYNSDKYIFEAGLAYENSLKVFDPADYPKYHSEALLAARKLEDLK